MQQLPPSLQFVRGHLWTQESLTPTQPHLHSHKCHHKCLLGSGWVVGLLVAFPTGIHPLFTFIQTCYVSSFSYHSQGDWFQIRWPQAMCGHLNSCWIYFKFRQIFKSSVPCLHWAHFRYSIICPGRQSYWECYSRAFKRVSFRILGLQWM